MEPIAVIDFETTGMSPGHTCRATEIAAVIVEDGRIVARYQNLMNSGAYVPPFIESLTGISNAMLRKAPPAAEVMAEVAEFVGRTPLVAHNASFDQKFWDAELGLIQRQRVQDFACSMLLARRLLPQAPNHKLGTLNSWAQLPHTGQAHRAMADAEMAANLMLFMVAQLRERHAIRDISHGLLCRLQKVPAAKIAEALSKARG
ncbi:PolC-type DNA polymerase III [Pseudomonas sp.]|uniref:3'-5' exonuclease n=1 Tax=Pseudomonas sp. TaxID=306 RepID=UPI003BB681CF